MENYKKAFDLIDEFAAKLLALNDGKKIPSFWQIRLKKALTPKPGNPGRKYDYAKVTEVVKYVILFGNKVKPVDRSKHSNQARYKDMIAKKTDAGSRRTVERYMEFVAEFFVMKPWVDEKTSKQNLTLISEYFTRMKSEPPELLEAIRKAFHESLLASYPQLKDKLESQEKERRGGIRSCAPE